MTFYKSIGEVPRKRHTAFRKADGSLYSEQVMGTKGFSGLASILYHHNPPAVVKEVGGTTSYLPEYEAPGTIRPRHFYTSHCERKSDPIFGRQYVLGNEDLLIGVVNPIESMDYFYRNGDGDELLFVHNGSGKVETMYGPLFYKKGDYIVIPIGTVYRIKPDDEKTKFLVVETNSSIQTPKRYRNEFGQLLEHSPFCERDIRGPEQLETAIQTGDFVIKTKTRGLIHSSTYLYHPFDVAGWDGYLYPWIFNINDFEPITGRIHLPPPIHQTFEGNNFVICSFVPRLYDYHPDAIPAPYYHSNVDSDEVLYYVEGNFMSRKGIEEGSITIHPMGIPHGPHPGKIEESLGQRETVELAVMIDAFRPLRVAQNIHNVEDKEYPYSWLRK